MRGVCCVRCPQWSTNVMTPNEVTWFLQLNHLEHFFFSRHHLSIECGSVPENTCAKCQTVCQLNKQWPKKCLFVVPHPWPLTVQWAGTTVFFSLWHRLSEWCQGSCSLCCNFGSRWKEASSRLKAKTYYNYALHWLWNPNFRLVEGERSLRRHSLYCYQGA